MGHRLGIVMRDAPVDVPTDVPRAIPKAVPRVVIDTRMVGDIPHGIARYVLHLKEGLKLQSQGQELPYRPVFLISDPSVEPFFTPFSTKVVNAAFLHPKEIFEIPKILRECHASLYHSPSFSSLWSCPCPSLVTIHDLNHLTYGEFSKKIYYQVLLKRFAKKSRVILTVSEFSRKEIANWLRIPETRIQIAYNAMSPPPTESLRSDVITSVLEKYNLTPRKYFFSISNLKPHKNLAILVQAYQKFRTLEPLAWPLVLTVRGLTSNAGILELGGLSELETSVLLSNCGGLFFPSLYEGFGLPPVEGAVAGVPLAISQIPPHREGLVDLDPHEVLWVPPQDLEGWIHAFQRIFRGEVPAPSQENRNKTLRRFSSARLGKQMDEIYREILGGNRH